MDNNTHNFQDEEYYSNETSGVVAEIPFLAKSYLFLGIAMFVSGLVGIGLGKLITYYPEIMMFAFYGGAIVVLITSFLINMNAYKNKSSSATLVAFIIYSIAMGAMISPIFIILSGDVLAISFGITALVFGGLALYGHFSKRDFFGFGAFISSLLFGGMIISLLNILIFGSLELNYIIEMVFLGVFLGYVIIDSNRIKRLQLAGETSSSLAIMCAMQLYSDFIYIFLRIALIVLSSKSKK
ncbi:MAG: Bax inhibitor-1/YccA family protein [Bacilli bacterium]